MQQSKYPDRKANNAGFTLVEMVVGITVAGMIVVALSNLLVSNDSLATRSKGYAKATSFSRNYMEGLRNTDFGALNTGTTTIADSELPDEIPEPRSATYEVVQLEPDLKQINFSLQYEVNDQDQYIEYSTMVNLYGATQ